MHTDVKRLMSHRTIRMRSYMHTSHMYHCTTAAINAQFRIQATFGQTNGRFLPVGLNVSTIVFPKTIPKTFQVHTAYIAHNKETNRSLSHRAHGQNTAIFHAKDAAHSNRVCTIKTLSTAAYDLPCNSSKFCVAPKDKRRIRARWMKEAQP